MKIQDNLNPLNHFTKAKVLVESHLKDLLKTMKGFKFIETLEVTFKTKEYDPNTGESEYIHKTAYFNSKAKTITNANEIGSELSISQQEIFNTIDIWVLEGYIDLPDELKNSAKGLMNIKNKDDECFRWCHIRHLNPQKKDPQRIKRIKPEDIKVPVIFHNLRGYDSHFIMQQIGEITKKHAYKNKKGEKQDLDINAIPNNMAKYMAFMPGKHLKFIDSFQFMSTSLDKLVSNLPKEDLKYTSEEFIGDNLSLMSQKGVYLYDYIYCFGKFNLTELPTKDEFFSILNDQHITNREYDHARKVWETFNLKNMGEYHDLDLKSDVLLLADVFESVRKTCLQHYKLDPCHYFTSPGLSWSAMLKMTNIELELMTDVDMFQFIEKGMRGGVSYIANRYGKAK